MNAVRRLVDQLSYPAQRRLAALPVRRFDDVDEVPADDLGPAAVLVARHGGSLPSLLNACARPDLEVLARAVGVDPSGPPSALRLALWHWGARLERGGAVVDGRLQPVPVVLGARLVVQAPPQGLYGPAAPMPRPVPPPRPPPPPREEPDSLDELLAAADALVGVRLGARGRDKGAWGSRVAAMLGVVERGDDEPDWRGDVEIKTVPVVAQADGRWRIAEDPAISMLDATPVRKLQRVLWLARASLADDDGAAPDATIIAWYLLDAIGDVPRHVARYLHVRPKGPRGTDARGWYLHKRFFAEVGLLAVLNGA